MAKSSKTATSGKVAKKTTKAAKPAFWNRPTMRSAVWSTPSTTSASSTTRWSTTSSVTTARHSAEGTLNGCFNEMTTLNGMPRIETPGVPALPDTTTSVPPTPTTTTPWAGLMRCAPYHGAEQVASHWHPQRHDGSWPAGLTDTAEHRDPVPSCDRRGTHDSRGGGGNSRADVAGERDRAGAAGGREHARYAARRRRAGNHEVQYFEMMGNRGIYHQGWTAVTKHRTPWKADTPPPFDDDVWELYGSATGLSRMTSRRRILGSSQSCSVLAHRSGKYNVVPLDDRGFERINPDIAGRPQLIRGNTQLLFQGMRVSAWAVLTLKNKSHSVTANLVVPKSGAEGVIITQGGSVGGWSLYAHEGKLKYCFNFFGIEHYIISAEKPILRRASTRCAWSSHTTAADWPGRRRQALLRRQGGQGPGRQDDPDGLLRRRGLRRDATRDRRRRRTTGRQAIASPVRSSGCSSTSAKTTTTT